jgi:PhzF family phenazine biosynthesis protein
MKLKIHHIDAFTDTVFQGNYAAVIILDEWLADDLMQSIATENNLSETAFVRKEDGQRYVIRWFSPITEIAFCGHATLAAAFVLFAEEGSVAELVFFAQAVGDITVQHTDEGYIAMTFPNRKPEPVSQVPRELTDGLSISPQEVLQASQAFFVVYASEQDVHDVQVNLEEIKKLAPRDVVVTAPSDEYDFVSRYFWPANGGAEDPVTGSIHAGLAPLWADRLGKKRLVAYQASSRGGLLRCEVKENQVTVSGKAVQYLEGVIDV